MFHFVIFQKNEASPFIPLHAIAWATTCTFHFFLHGSSNWAYNIFRCHVNKKDFNQSKHINFIYYDFYKLKAYSPIEMFVP